MYKFTSPLTHNRLKSQKDIITPDFEYSSFSQIDTIYQDFCRQSRKELFQVRKTQSKGPEKERLASETIDNEDILGLKTAKLGFMKDKIKQFNNKGKGNPVAKMFGNTVIAAIFQSLIIKTVETMYGVQVEDPLSFSHK